MSAFEKKKRGGASVATTASRRKSPQRKRAKFAPINVLLVGFNDREKNELQADCNSRINFNQCLSSDITHVILKPSSIKDKSFRWTTLLYAIVSGAWILTSSWLIDSKKKEELLDEKSYILKKSIIDIHFSPKTSGISIKEMLELYDHFESVRAAKQAEIFSGSVFQKVLILGKKTQEGKQKKNDLRSLIEAGGGMVCARDDTFSTLRTKPNRAKQLVSAIILLNNEKLDDHMINVHFVRLMLNYRIPVLYEEFLTEAIRNKIVANEEIMLVQSIDYWKNKHEEKMEFDENAFRWITTGIGEPEVLPESSVWQQRVDGKSMEKESTDILKPSQESRVTAIKNAHLPRRFLSQPTMEDGIVSVSDDENLLDEFTKEIILHHDDKKDITDEMKETENEERRKSVIIHPTISSFSNSSLMPSIPSLSLTGNNCFASFERQPVSWKEWRAKLKMDLSCAMDKDMDMGEQSDSSRQFLEGILSELKNNPISSVVHDLICLEVCNFMRNSKSLKFLPSADLLSKILFEIAMPCYGEQFNASDNIYTLINLFSQQFPPNKPNGRYFWLKVLTNIAESKGKKIERSGVDSLTKRVGAFRKLVVDSFLSKDTNTQLLDVFVTLIEYDLYLLQNNQQREIYIQFDDNLLSKEDSRCLSDLRGVPLAYMIFYDHNDRRKRGLDSSAMKTCIAIIDIIADSDNTIRSNLATRFLGVCLEGLRWFLSEITHVFVGNNISHDMMTDIQRIARKFASRGYRGRQITDLLPIDWIHTTVMEE